MYIVLMAGGAGTRFWPLSRKDSPKQLLNLFTDKTMLQLTYERIRELTSPEKVLIITGENLVDAVAQQLPEIPAENIIAEPIARNTAPCIALASTIIEKREKGRDEVMAVLPADHLVYDEEKFRETLNVAAGHARQTDALITLGITPSYPETGYGYIQRAEIGEVVEQHKIHKVKTFAEKPNLETADRFLKSGDFYWNSGIFIWTVQSILSEFERQVSDLYYLLPALKEKIDTPDMTEAILKAYSSTRSISIDYAVMEGARNVKVIEADFRWSDVGSWEAVYNLSEKDKYQNALLCDRSIVIDATNNYFHSRSGKLIAAVDVDDLIVVETDDTILVCRKDKSQRVKEVVDKLRLRNMEEYL